MYNEIVRLMVHLHVVLTISGWWIGEDIQLRGLLRPRPHLATLSCSKRQAASPRPQSVALFFLYLLVNTNEGARGAF